MKQMSNMKKGIRLVLLAAAAALLLAGSVMAADKTVRFKKLVNKDAVLYEGVFEDGQYIYHRFSVPADGAVFFTGARFNKSNQMSGLYGTLCRVSNKSVLDYKSQNFLNADKEKGACYVLKKGTYLYRIRNGGKGYEYALSAAYEQVKDRSGASKKKAAAMKAGQVYAGLLIAGDSTSKSDWFKITVNGKKKIKLITETAGQGKIRVRFTGKSGTQNQFLTADKKGTSTLFLQKGSRQLALPAGTYYVQVSKAAGVKTGMYYEIKWQYA